MAKPQFNVRLSEEGRAILDEMIEYFQASNETGRPVTQTEIIERALRRLRDTEKPPRRLKIPKSS
jgi:hypothetical protein